ncbi:unnamed protein product, partial [Iphiclides podalirius]
MFVDEPVTAKDTRTIAALTARCMAPALAQHAAMESDEPWQRATAGESGSPSQRGVRLSPLRKLACDYFARDNSSGWAAGRRPRLDRRRLLARKRWLDGSATVKVASCAMGSAQRFLIGGSVAAPDQGDARAICEGCVTSCPFAGRGSTATGW